MINEILADEDEQMFITGMVMVCDCTGYTLGHFTQFPMAMMKKLMQCWEVGYCECYYGHYIPTIP